MFDLTVDVDPDDEDHMSVDVDVHGQVEGGDMIVSMRITELHRIKQDI